MGDGESDGLAFGGRGLPLEAVGSPPPFFEDDEDDDLEPTFYRRRPPLPPLEDSPPRAAGLGANSWVSTTQHGAKCGVQFARSAGGCADGSRMRGRGA